MRKRTGALVLALAMSGCADDPEAFDAIESVPTSASTIRETLEQSGTLDLFDDLFESEAVEPTAIEQELLDLLLPADQIPVPHRLVSAQASDPNGDGAVGEYWYPPRLLGESAGAGCSIRLDVPPLPAVGGVYIPGDPTVAVPDGVGATFDLFEAPSSLSVEIFKLDSREQRDALLVGQLEFVGALSEGLCGFVSLEQTFGVDDDFDVRQDLGSGVFPEIETFVPADTGYPAWGVVLDGGLPLLGEGERRLYEVGDRLLVDISSGRSFIQQSGEPIGLTSAQLDDVVALLIERLVAAGYG